MKQVKLSNLEEGTLFEHRGVIYEIIRKCKWSSYCRYVNDAKCADWCKTKYLYCSFSNYTKVSV